MGGTCSSEDTKFACPIGMFSTAKCTSSCWKAQEEKTQEEDPADRRLKAAIRVETDLLRNEILARAIAGLSGMGIPLPEQPKLRRRGSI